MEDFTGPLDALVFQLIDGHDGVDEAHIKGFLGGVLAAEIPDFAGFFLAYNVGQIRGTETAVETAHLGADLAHDGIIGSDGKIADDMEDMASANGIARDEGDHYLGHRADETLEVEDIEAGNAMGVNVASLFVAAYILVTACAKRVFAIGVRAGACEENNTNGGIITGISKGVNHFRNRLGGKGVAPMRAINCDFGNALCLVVEDILIIASGLPLDIIHWKKESSVIGLRKQRAACGKRHRVCGLWGFPRDEYLMERASSEVR